MKKVLLFALLLAATSALSAQAQYMAPLAGTYYDCTYTNTNLHELNGVDGGFSRFDISGAANYLQGSEVFQATYGVDRRKVTFAKPVNIFITNAKGEQVWRGTRWEFTINPAGPQCKNTIVRDSGYSISFLDCTDGSSRFCTPY